MAVIGYADCPAGVSGDMFLAACLDAGLPLEHLEGELSKLNLGGYHLRSETVMKQGLAARSFTVDQDHHHHHHRHWSDIRAMIQASGLAEPVRAMTLTVFERIARAEARMHGVEPDQVHFHEVGAVDSIVDIAGAAIAMDYFQIGRLYASPLPLGSGFIMTAHGRLPLPAPATLALLEGVPTYGSGLEAELVTPTGAALLAALCHGFGSRPAMTVSATGMGAGTRNLPDRPNILRLTLGTDDAGLQAETLMVAETNIDDMNPEIYPYLVERLLAEGALDAWLTPIQMKKGRPAVTLSVLARSDSLPRLTRLILNESSTLGVRTYPVRRESLRRESRMVATPWGPVAVKVIHRDGRTETVPEYEACLKAARESGLPLREIYDRVKTASE